jgi:hypothetical protein
MKLETISNDKQLEILGEEPKRMMFGHFFPASAQTAVGARMILDRYSLSYVSGRVARLGQDQDLDQKTADMCVEIALADKLFKFMKDNGVYSSSSDVIFGEAEGYRMLATPNGSYGYVYLSVWAV